MTAAGADRGPAALVAGALGAAALAVPIIARFEGYRPTGYKDPAPAAHDTICYGHRQPGVAGRRLTDAQCAELLAADAVRHGLDISGCVPADTPQSARAAFTSFAFNVGAARFCASTVARKAQRRDWRGACEELPKWIFAGGKPLAGLAARRRAERELCVRDL